MRVLFASSWFPFPPTNGSELRVYNLLRVLAAAHEVTLVSFSDQPDVDRRRAEIRELCADVAVVGRRRFNPRSRRARFGFFSAQPRSIVDTHSAEMAALIHAALDGKHHDLVIASQLGTAAYAPYFGGTPALFDEVELAMLYDQLAHSRSPVERFRHRLTWMKHCRYLGRLLRSFGACTVVSRQELDLLHAAVPGYESIEIVPNFVTIEDYAGVRGEPKEGQLIFSGSLSYEANHGAVAWFLTEVYPLVRARLPSARLVITGESEGQRLPAAENVLRTGLVEDVRPWIASSWLSISPTQEGGGTRVKILESMALGTPVVATSKGAEGLDALAGEHVLIADDAPAFAAAVLRLLSDPALRRRLSDNGRRMVREQYEARQVGPRFLEVAERAAGRRS
jgi:glycosyltransferase involved in cell wall biosynthesis